MKYFDHESTYFLVSAVKLWRRKSFPIPSSFLHLNLLFLP